MTSDFTNMVMVDDSSDMEDTSFMEHQDEEKHPILKTPTTNYSTRYKQCADNFYLILHMNI